MTQEEKARAYDEALARAKDMMSYKEVRREDMEYLFPELKKSEDERVRKELIDAVQGLWSDDALPMPLSVKRKNEWLAWLKKQGQVKDSVISQHENKMCKENGDSLTNEDEKIRKELLAVVNDLVLPDEQQSRFIAWIEKQGEQKPADKVEPKFKPGDWVIRKDGTTFSNNSICARVQRIEGHNVWFEHGTYSNEWVLNKITDLRV